MSAADVADREAVRGRVLGVDRCCAHCGTIRLSQDTKITPDRVRGSGEHVWGVCGECGPAARVGNLSAVVVCDLLGLDPDDPVVPHAVVESFYDADVRSPDRPNTSPWQHIDTDALASWVARWRQDIERRTGGPCSWCGMGVTPPGTVWQTFGKAGGTEATCGACHDRFGGIPLGRSGHNRDRAAAVVVGLERGSQLKIPLNLGAQLGFVWWHETGRKKPNNTPFGHLDATAMRTEAKRLADDNNYFTPPARWDPTQVVVAW